MRKLYFSILILIFLLIPSAYGSVSALSAPAEQIDFAALDTAITAQMAKHGLPGVELAVIEDGQVVYLKAYGEDGNGQPLTPQTPMYIGSQSKSFTALAIAQLAEEGKLDLNAPVQTYIPWFRVADESASAKITINHLLHHSSGLSDSGFSTLLPDNTSTEDAVRSLSNARLTAPVGTAFQYFNMGYTVLAYVIEQISGQSYAAFIQEHILTPLEMNASSADPTSMTDMPKGCTRLFGFAVPAAEAAPVYGVAAGWIVSNAEDMARYAIEFQTGKTGLVSAEMMKRILSPALGGYGMGWFIYDNGAKILHGGANQTFRTEVNQYPRTGRAFVLLTNEGYQIDHFISASQLTASVEAVVLGKAVPVVSDGWSVRWIGWAVGVLVLGLCILHTANILALRGWVNRTRSYPTAKRVWDVAISFLIPIAISAVVLWQVQNFYGNRFNLLPSLSYMRFGLPDIFILMLVGTLPDLLQGVIKIILWRRNPSSR